MINATNHLGWGVQLLTENGWEYVDQEYPLHKGASEAICVCLRTWFPNREWRVYEVVK